MVTRRFSCTLLTDVVLSSSNGSACGSETLDFIPGNCFLGIVAKHYSDFGDKALDVFHSTKVRFSDAHLSNDGLRSLKMPLCFFKPKYGSVKHYVHHGIPDLQDECILSLQLKQCRDDFVIFKDGEAYMLDACRSLAVKSSYDYSNRCSKDGQLFTYQSLQSGLTFLFEVEFDGIDDIYIDKVCKYLIGEKHLGRSRTAQYGLVSIAPADYPDYSSSVNEKISVVYAESRLIFMDENGTSVFTPTAEQLGIKGGRLIVEKSQVRTFQYAPFNGARKKYDCDRCGVEKGSVFYVLGGEPRSGYGCVGHYRNEGFGRVIYNPDFLSYDVNGLSSYKILKLGQPDTDGRKFLKNAEIYPLEKGSNSLLFEVLSQDGNAEVIENVRKEAMKWVMENKHFFNSKEEAFASQWGTIRASSVGKSYADVWEFLFEEETGYLMHGVAKYKWERNGRLDKWKGFCMEHTVDCIIEAANLMAKECKR